MRWNNGINDGGNGAHHPRIRTLAREETEGDGRGDTLFDGEKKKERFV